MKSLHKKLVLSFTFLMASILVGIGLFFSLFLPIYMEESIKANSLQQTEAIVQILENNNTNLSSAQIDEIEVVLSSDPSGNEFSTIRNMFWVVLFMVLIGALIVMLMITNRLSKTLAHPIDNVTAVAIELAKGNYRARAYEEVTGHSVQLSTSINILARNLQDMSKIREVEKERLKTLIENMGSALMMIGRDGQISIVNRAFLTQFNIDYKDIQNSLFKSVGLPLQLEKFIDIVFLTESAKRRQLSLDIHQEHKHMEVYGAPVIGEHGRWLGVVIVIHDITDLIRLEQIRKDFVANVSHELRTPVTSIKGFSETLLDGAFKDEKTLLAFLEIIYKESNRLQMLIEDLLELSKIEQHGFSVEFSRVNLLDVMVRAAEMTSQRLEEKDMTFITDIERDIYVEGDLNRLIQVVMNLLTNAITYSPEKTSIHMRLQETDTHGIITIRDEGIGIETNEISRIFERFYRVDRARSRNSGGTGLGLAIVKHLIEAHQGRIHVESETGKGTTFEIFIPKTQQS